MIYEIYVFIPIYMFIPCVYVFVRTLGLKLIRFKISERRITGITRSDLQVAMQAVHRQRWQHRPSREAPQVIAPTPRQGERLLISSNSSNKPHSNNSQNNRDSHCRHSVA